MTRNRTVSVIGAALLIGAAGVAHAQSTSPPSPLDRRDDILKRQGVTRKTSSANQRYALPSVKIKGLGVKSSAPRGIGKKGGVLLPEYADAPAPSATPAGMPDVRGDDPFRGRVVPDRYGQPRVLPGRAVPPMRVDPDVLRSGDNIAIGRMLWPTMLRSRLSRRDQMLLDGFSPCGMRGYFDSVGAPSTFGNDTYAPNDTMLDPTGLDPFVLAGGPNGAPPGQPPMGAADPEARLNAFEKAGNRLYDGTPDEAVVLLRMFTRQHPDDAEAARALALALIDSRRTREGVELIGQVYARHPALADSALPRDSVGPEHEMRDLVVRVVEFAQRENTAAAWLTVAMLMQAEGRLDPALKMIDRADTRQLSAEVSAAMRSALKP